MAAVVERVRVQREAAEAALLVSTWCEGVGRALAASLPQFISPYLPRLLRALLHVLLHVLRRRMQRRAPLVVARAAGAGVQGAPVYFHASAHQAAKHAGLRAVGPCWPEHARARKCAI